MEGYARMCSSGQCNGEYNHMQKLSIVYMLICIAGQSLISSCEVVANGGYAQVQWWSMEDMLMCSSGQ